MRNGLIAQKAKVPLHQGLKLCFYGVTHTPISPCWNQLNLVCVVLQNITTQAETDKQNRAKQMTYLDDIWYVGGSRSEVAHAEFWAWQMPIKYLICIIYAKICTEHFSGTVSPTWMIFGMWVGPKVPMVTLMEVKGHQRSNGVNYVLWLPYLVKSPDASWEWWWPWWRSEVKWGKLCAMATIFGQKKPWCKLRMMMTMEVRGQMG